MVVVHNLYAINANRMTGIVNEKGGKIAEKLSSGYRINRAADDAAGLSISEKLRRQIRGLTQAALNAQDGISLVQSAEGALNEIHEIVQRGNELAVKAANGTLTDLDREMVDDEIQQLKQALDESAHSTVFNEVRLFPDDGNSPKASIQTAHYNVQYQMLDGTITVTGQADQAQSSTGSGDTVSQTLADVIADEFVPNAIKQIFDAFPTLASAVGSNTIEMALDISYIDGPSNTLAYAQCSYSLAGGTPFNFLVKVDSSDFTDADALGTGSKAEMLESTLAHELMHSVMQYTMTDEMTGRDSAVEEFPDWFVEGTAQLSGGGYTTGWNDTLTSLKSSLTDENDTSKDAEIAAYLQKYTVAGRPYGHGYLASAYAAYLANGTGEVSSEAIANGMNKIFADIIQDAQDTSDNKSFSDAIKDNTGKTASEIEAMFTNATSTDDLVVFVRKLSKLTGTGAGSAITSSLNVGGTDILGDTALEQQFRIDPNKVNVDASSGSSTGGGSGKTQIWLQVGSEASVGIGVKLFQMDAKALGLEDTNVKTQGAASDAIDEFKAAIQSISKVRSYYGAVQNRLEHTINNLENVVENTTAAESAIRDTDMAKTMVEMTTNNILQQAGQAILSQTNRYPEFILKLLS